MASIPTNFSPIKSYAIDILGNCFLRLPPLSLEKKIHNKFRQVNRGDIKAVIRELITEGVLAYTQQYSTTYLVLAPSSDIPSSRVSLQPCRALGTAARGRIPLFLNDGVSFGDGEHPTSRLCLAGLDVAIRRINERAPRAVVKAIDLGTGSGVLAVAMALLGAHSVVAVDVDPLACHEAQANAALNCMEAKIRLVAGTLECLGRLNVNLVTMNLRTPTLVKILPMMIPKLPAGSMIVLSGFRPQEEKGLQSVCPSGALTRQWYGRNRGWAAMVVELKDAGGQS